MNDDVCVPLVSVRAVTDRQELPPSVLPAIATGFRGSRLCLGIANCAPTCTTDRKRAARRLRSRSAPCGGPRGVSCAIASTIRAGSLHRNTAARMSRATSLAHPHPLTFRRSACHLASELQRSAKTAWAHARPATKHVEKTVAVGSHRFGHEQPDRTAIGAGPLRMIAAHNVPNPSHDSLAPYDLTASAGDVSGSCDHGTLLGHVDEPRDRRFP